MQPSVPTSTKFHPLIRDVATEESSDEEEEKEEVSMYYMTEVADNNHDNWQEETTPALNKHSEPS